jgi:hypothetical protein
MLESIPVALQAILWPLLGAAIVVTLNRLLPNWAGRLVALAAGAAALAALWSLGGQAEQWLQGYWEPFTFLRTGPALRPDPLGLFVSISLAAFAAVGAMGIRGSQHPKTAWHGLNLLLLTGCLVMALAANLLTLALGSGLVDLALVAMVASAASGAGQGQRVTWRLSVPGLISTLLLVAAAVRMDAQSGTQSWQAQQLLPEVLALLGAAGLLRMAVFPLYPRGLQTPEQAASLLTLIGAGILLLARAQGLGPGMAGQTWFLALGAVALLAGGWQAWTAGSARPLPAELPERWGSLAIHQTGTAILFALLFPDAAPWALVSLVLALGLLVFWWDAAEERPSAPPSTWLAWMSWQLGLGWSKLRSWLGRSADQVGWLADLGARLRAQRLKLGLSAAVLPTLALLSLAGVPLTVGAATRSRLYGALLGQGRPLLLITLWAGDALLAGGLWLAWQAIERHAPGERLRPHALAAMVFLALCTVALALAPGILTGHVGLELPARPAVSVWGVGLLSFLPWLVGAWLARTAAGAGFPFERLRRAITLDAAFGAADRLGQQLVTAANWLRTVGEGEGWWGWALIILSLAALYLSVR